MTIRWWLYFFNCPSLWVIKIFWSPYYVAIENFQLPKKGGLVIFPPFWSSFWSPSNNGDQIQKKLLSYLACSHIWLNLPMDDCHFGYRGKGMWQGQVNLVAFGENPPFFFFFLPYHSGFFPLFFGFLPPLFCFSCFFHGHSLFVLFSFLFPFLHVLFSLILLFPPTFSLFLLLTLFFLFT